jgi:hypothetical protein
MSDYKKYLKYKNKYLALKNKIFGGSNQVDCENVKQYIKKNFNGTNTDNVWNELNNITKNVKLTQLCLANILKQIETNLNKDLKTEIEFYDTYIIQNTTNIGKAFKLIKNTIFTN